MASMRLRGSPAPAPKVSRRSVASYRRAVPSLSLSIVALAPVFAGCRGDPQEPSSNSAVARATSSDSGGTPSSDSGATPSTDHPNQPEGFTRLAEWAATSLFPAGGAQVSSGAGILAGEWSRSADGLGTATDATAPESPSNVVAYTWPAGLQPGTSPGTFNWWVDGSASGYSKLYESGWIKIPSEDFEEHGPSGGLKLIGYWSSGQTRGNNLFGWTAGVGTNPVSAFKFELRQQGFVTRNLDQNVDTQPLLTCGSWHHYEILMELNTVGSADGTFQMWIDGNKTHNYTDVIYRTESNPKQFFARRWDAVWGGTGGESKTRTDKLWIDHIYMSGVR